MSTISLCMIVKDEEAVLDRCLNSVKAAMDEIVIVDTGSADRTKEIARKYTDKIFDFSWQDDFSAARNFAFEKGQMDYLMWLDADDVLSEESGRNLLLLKERLSEKTDMVLMPYAVSFDEEGRVDFSYYRERIVKNHKGYLFSGRVHEVISPRGTPYYADQIIVEHRKVKTGYSKRNLRIYEKMEKNGETLDVRALYYYGRELLFHGCYKKSAEILERFLDDPEGWVENKIDGTRQLALCKYNLKDEKGALMALLKGLEYDVPRGETCCDLGRHFMDRGKYKQAAYWLEQALTAKKATRSGAFVQEDCYGFLPAIWLCICYECLGDHKLAQIYNELAGRYKPRSPYYLANKEYFQSLGDAECEVNI